MSYGKRVDLQKDLLYKKIVAWSKDALVLEDGTEVFIEMSEFDCCAIASGKFSNVKLDAAITSIEFGVPEDVPRRGHLHHGS